MPMRTKKEVEGKLFAQENISRIGSLIVACFLLKNSVVLVLEKQIPFGI
jgi:hypothetical protein